MQKCRKKGVKNNESMYGNFVGVVYNYQYYNLKGILVFNWIWQVNNFKDISVFESAVCFQVRLDHFHYKQVKLFVIRY